MAPGCPTGNWKYVPFAVVYLGLSINGLNEFQNVNAAGIIAGVDLPKNGLAKVTIGV